MKYPIKRAIHLDFHTMPGIYNFNENWDAEKFAERLEKAHVKYINAFAQCNLGFAYFDTKIGYKYPGMKGDMFGDLLRECHKRGIGVTAYFNFGLDHEALRLHRDWMKVNENGNVLWGDRTGNSFRIPCYETGYAEYKLSLIKEFIELHPDVDGLFLDCINISPCYGNECLEAIKRNGGDPKNPEDVKRHTINSVHKNIRKIKEMIGDRNLVASSQPYWSMREFNTHVEVECLPGANAWNYDFFAVNSAYARNIVDKVVYMTGRFRSNWGDFGGIKTTESIEHDMFDALMYAGECSIGDHMHPAEIVDKKVYDLVEKVYSKIESLEPWTDGAKFVADVGVLCPIDSGYFIIGSYPGLSRMLSELKIGFDIVNETMDFSKYKLLIIPDDVRITPEMERKVKEHLRLGKPVLSTGTAGLRTCEDKFIYDDVDFNFADFDTDTQAFYKYDDDEFRYAVYYPGVKVSAGKTAKIIAKHYKSYFNREWDGFHGYYYMPPEKDTGYAMAVKSGNVCHIGFKVFNAYYENAYTEHKILVKKCLDELGFEPTIKTDLPSYARATLTETNKHLLLHVKTTFAELRGKLITIEERVKYPAGSTVTIKGEYENGYIIPINKKVNSKIVNGETVITLPEIDGNLIIAFDK